MEKPAREPAHDELHKALDETHSLLLHIHKALLDHERRKYEAIHGPAEVPALQLIMNDPWFAWLKPLSALITQIDQLTAGRDPMAPDAGRAALARARQLLAPREDDGPFQREYLRTIQESPEIASWHGQWKQLLQSPMMHGATTI